ncbi:MAG: hypothetical protein HN952_03000 [Candidatus Cloacimonetes bacterium]|jgi:hypothetical protein|nr:hypothetical protein [Candidatus Cloacimonadota bacterium]MBT6993903.1 hypothetical protein [Candidatus Cloacimonadota bacterium]MBT7468942.1 hypothetical protein [Candidatus Cloacimonadota bacterium]
MKSNKIIFSIILILIVANIFAVFDDYEPSPRARAMGGAFYSFSNDAYAIFYNPAGLIHADNHFESSYAKVMNNDFQALNTVVFSMKLPKKFGNIGLGLQSMDVDFQDVNLMSEKIYALSHSITLMKDIHSELNFGHTFNMYHLTFDGLGNQPSFGVNLGMLATLHQRTKIGFTITNLNNPKVGVDNLHELPQKMVMGISYEPYTGVITALELEKPLAGKTEIHAGTELQITKIFALNFGIRSNPASYSAGARFDIYNVIVEYGFNTHTIGETHHFGLGYKF